MKIIFYLIALMFMASCGDKPAPKAKATPTEAPPVAAKAQANAQAQAATIKVFNEFVLNNGSQLNCIGHIQFFKLPDGVSGVIRESVTTDSYLSFTKSINTFKRMSDRTGVTGPNMQTLYLRFRMTDQAIFVNKYMQDNNIECVINQRIKRSPTEIKLPPGKYVVKFGGTAGSNYVSVLDEITISDGKEVDLDALRSSILNKNDLDIKDFDNMIQNCETYNKSADYAGQQNSYKTMAK